jgi:hypothetical protein
VLLLLELYFLERIHVKTKRGSCISSWKNEILGLVLEDGVVGKRQPA